MGGFGVLAQVWTPGLFEFLRSTRGAHKVWQFVLAVSPSQLGVMRHTNECK
jgi:hypothetical protein